MMNLQLPEDLELSSEDLQLPPEFKLRPELAALGNLSLDSSMPAVDKRSSFTLSQTGTFSKGDFQVGKNGIIDTASQGAGLRESRLGTQLSIDDLEMKQILGQGASGVVRLAHHKPTGQDMAVKTINVLDKGKRDQMVKELKIMSKNECGSLVALYDAFYEEGSMQIVMEYMDGGSLAEVVKHYKDGGLRNEAVLRAVSRQMLEGLYQLHHVQHQIHRDLKPANVMCNTSGDVKISDFGISTELENTMAMASTFVGTASYMSPDRLGGMPYSFSSDIWAVGMMVVELATGKYPYTSAGNYFSLINNIIEGDAPQVQHGSPELADFVQKMMQKEPKDRQSAADLLSHPWIIAGEGENVDLAGMIKEVKAAN